MKSLRWRRNTLGKFLSLLSMISFIYLSGLLLRHGLLPSRFRWALILVLFLIQGALIYGSFRPRVSSGKRFVFGLLSTLLFLVMGLGGFYLGEGLNTLDKMAAEDEDVIAFSMVVLKDSPIEDWVELKKNAVATALGQDREHLSLYLSRLEKETGERLEILDAKSYVEGAQNLLDGRIPVFLLNESYRELIDEQMAFSINTRIINPSSVKLSKVKVNHEKIVKEAKKQESFHFYISGIDTYGQLATVSRSDVNLLVTVNPRDQKIMITTIPRDTYLPLAEGGMEGYDKLTHAGIYGVKSSVKTLENFLDIDINYYARVNFSSLIRIVDVLGGIDVDNDQAFGAFSQGRIHLDGEGALRFSRERYALERGDFDRGMNQTKVLAAMIEKALSPAILMNYSDFLKVALSSTETNIPKDKLIELVNQQLDKKSKWEIRSQEIRGVGEMGLPSYAMPGWNLYMLVPSRESVEGVKKEIVAVYGL